MEDVGRETERKAEGLGDFVGLRPETETPLHAAGLGIADAQHDALEAHRPIHGFENDAQDVVELEAIDQGIADVLDAGSQDVLRVDGERAGGIGIAGGERRRFVQDGRIHAGFAAVPLVGRALLVAAAALGKLLHLLAEGGLLHVEVNDAGEIRHFLDGTLHGLLQLLLVERHDVGEARHRLLHFPVTRLRRGLGDHVAQLVGEAGEDAQTVLERHRPPHLAARQAPQGTDDERRETPLAGNRDAHVLKGNAEHLQGGIVFAAAFLGDDATDLVGFFGEIELRQQAAQAVKQRTDEGLFEIAHLRRGTDVLGENAGQVGTQEVFLELVGIGLVLQMLEEQYGDRDVAHRLEAEHDHGARHGADAAAAGRPEIGRIDQAQQLVGQREVLEDGVGQFVDALRLAVGDLVDRADRFGERRKIALVAHAAEQEVDGRLLALAAARAVVLGVEIVVERVGQLRGALVADLRIARQGLVQNAGQALVYRHAGRQLQVFVGDAVHHLVDVAALDGTPPGQHLEKDQAGREDVGTLADLALLDVLGRHVGRRAGVLLVILVRRIDARRDAEVHDARNAVFVEQNIGRLEIAVDDALRVRMRHRVEDGAHRGDRLDRRQGAAGVQEFGQVLARHVFEDQVEIAALLARLENRHDVGVAQFADQARLVEQDAVLGRVGAPEMQGLDSDLALQLRIESAVDRALGAAAEFAAHFEASDVPAHAASIQCSCGTPSAPPQTIAFWP